MKSGDDTLIRDSRLRSWTKGILWRIIGIVILGFLGYLFTGSWKETTLIVVTFHGIQLIMYYWFERGWEHIRWGRNDV
jgi:uncharacterized membrane protein